MPEQKRPTIRKGQTLELKCERMDTDGAAVAVASGDAHVALASALVGDRVTATIDHVSPHRKGETWQAWGHVVQVHQHGPHHVDPFCPAFGACGGCLWQHMSYDEQLRNKRQFVEEALRRHAINAPVAACVPSPMTRGYRNQAKYVVGEDGSRLGGYAPRTHTVLDLVECALVEPAVTTLIKRVQAALEQRRLPSLRHVVIRANAAGQTLLTLVLRHAEAASDPHVVHLAEQLKAHDSQLVGVVANINGTPGDVIFGDHEIVLCGEPSLNDVIAGIEVVLSPRAFFQVNRHVATLAYDAIAAFAATVPNVNCLWDVYAGVGTIARVVARHVATLAQVYCVEIRAAAVNDARAAWQDSSGAAFHAIAADAADAFASQTPSPDFVVLNPPRAGCDVQVLQLVAARCAPAIAYLSCNAETLARDLAVLTTLGYAITDVTPYDMLPHTPHVETLVQLRHHSAVTALR